MDVESIRPTNQRVDPRNAHDPSKRLPSLKPVTKEPLRKTPRSSKLVGEEEKGAEIRKLLETLGIELSQPQINVRFTVHEETGRIVIRIINAESGELIKEIPSKEFLDTVAKIMKYVGLIFDKKA